MARILTYLSSITFAITLSSAAVASQNLGELAHKIIQQGYVDPSQYATPQHIEDHRQALEWMLSLAGQDALTKLADRFAQLIPPSVKLHSKKMSVELGATLLNASPHTLSLATYGTLLDSCSKSAAAGICDIRQFKNLGLGNDFRRYNQDIVFLSAAYVHQLQLGRAQPNPDNNMNNNNNLVEVLLAPPAQLRQPPAAAEEQGGEENIMDILMEVNFDQELGDYVNESGFKPLPMDDGSVIFHDLKEGRYLMFDAENGSYYEL